MFVINDDLSIYITRGDAAKFFVTADFDGIPYRFQVTDIVRFKVFEKKGCDCVVLQRDFAVTEAADMVEIALTRLDTKIGGIIHKPKDYWYEVELNPETHPQTIIGYDEDGAKVFRLLPEGKDYDDERPDYDPPPDAYQYMIDMTARNVALTMQAQRVSTKAMTDSATAIKDSAEAKALAQEVKDRADAGEFKGEKGDPGLTGQKGRGYEGNKRLTLIADGSCSPLSPVTIKIPNAMLVESIVVKAELHRSSENHWRGGIYYGQWNGGFTNDSHPVYEDNDGDGVSENIRWWYSKHVSTDGLVELENATYSESGGTEHITVVFDFCNGGFVLDGNKFILKEDLHADDEHYITIIPHGGWNTSSDFAPDGTEQYAYSVYCIEREDNGEVIPEDHITDAANRAVAEHNESETAHSDLRQAVSAAQAEIERLKENGVAGGGLNEEAANLLVDILRHATYDEDVSIQIDRLEEILLGDSGGDTGGDNTGGDTDSGLTITDDGNGNVVITTFGNATIIDDGNGNVTIPLSDGVTITDDGNGNVVIA